MNIRNLFDHISDNTDKEFFEDLLRSRSLRIERIISTGQTTPEGEWLVQDSEEFVLLVQGRSTLQFKNGEEISMREGDHLLIPANTPHRVAFTQADPPCVWLAVHF